MHLDALRLASALGIVGVHSFLFFIPREARHLVAEATIGMNLLVDLFFTISGFVIAYFYSEGVRTGDGVRKFYRRRAARVLPLHWIALATCLVFWLLAAALGVNATSAPNLSPACVVHTALLLDGLRACGGIPLNYVSWTLSVEVVMYVAFPLLALAARRHPTAFTVVALTAAGVGVILCSEFVTLRGWLNLPPLFRAAPAFLIGMGLFTARTQIRSIPYPRHALALALVMLVGAMIGNAAPWLQLGLTYVSVALAVASDNGKPTQPFVRLMSGASQLTYSIYMWHLLFVTFFLAALADHALGGSISVAVPLAALCYLSLLSWSYVSFRYVETPARKWLDQALSNLAPSAIGVRLTSRHGLRFRLPLRTIRRPGPGRGGSHAVCIRPSAELGTRPHDDRSRFVRAIPAGLSAPRTGCDRISD